VSKIGKDDPAMRNIKLVLLLLFLFILNYVDVFIDLPF
jgi:hypothetical protein